MKLRKWMSAALIVSLVAANNQAMGSVNAFTSSDYVKNEVSVLEQEAENVTPTPIPTPTATPKILGGYAVTYINEGETTTEGWYPAGGTTTITLKTPEDRGRGWRFVGWKDMEGNLHEAGTEVAVYNVPSATFTAVWLELQETASPGAITTMTPSAVVTSTPTITPPTVTPTIAPTPTILADYDVTYIDGDKKMHIGWYPVGRITTITLIEPEIKEGYVFVGWKDYKGNLYQPREEVGVCDVPSATFTAVWEKLQETVTPSVVVTTTPTASAITTETSTPNVTPTVIPSTVVTPTPTVTPTVASTPKPVAKKAKVKITTSTKKKFVVGKKYTIKAKRINTSKKLTWSVSNKKYATINKYTGVLKAKKAGKVTITVICGKVKDKIKIVIKKK